VGIFQLGCDLHLLTNDLHAARDYAVLADIAWTVVITALPDNLHALDLLQAGYRFLGKAKAKVLTRLAGVLQTVERIDSDGLKTIGQVSQRGTISECEPGNCHDRDKGNGDHQEIGPH